MAKKNFGAAIAFGTQSAEGTYNTTLDGITTSLSGDPDSGDQGLVLGAREGGIGETGISFAAERLSEEKGVIAGSFTHPIDDLLRVQVSQLQFAFQFGGSRRDTLGTLTDADYDPGLGVQAILAAAGLVGSDWAGGNGRSYTFGAPNPISVLLYLDGKRYELLDCRANSLEVEYVPGAIPIGTVDLAVGSIKEVTEADLPTTVSYGEQATVTLPKVQAVGSAWGAAAWPFSALTLRVSPTVEEIPDSNALQGIVREISGRETRIVVTFYTDDSDESIDYDEMGYALDTDLSDLFFTVGTAAGINTRATAHAISVPKFQVVSSQQVKLGSKTGHELEAIARHTTANLELEIRFI